MIQIFSYLKDGKVEFHKSLDLIKNIKNRRIWLDATNITMEESQVLAKNFQLHPLTVEDLRHYQTRIKVEEFHDYLVCVFYGLKKDKKYSLQEIDFILGKNFLITSHSGEIESFEHIKKNSDVLLPPFRKGMD